MTCENYMLCNVFNFQDVFISFLISLSTHKTLPIHLNSDLFFGRLVVSKKTQNCAISAEKQQKNAAKTKA